MNSFLGGRRVFKNYVDWNAPACDGINLEHLKEKDLPDLMLAARIQSTA